MLPRILNRNTRDHLFPHLSKKANRTASARGESFFTARTFNMLQECAHSLVHSKYLGALWRPCDRWRRSQRKHLNLQNIVLSRLFAESTMSCKYGFRAHLIRPMMSRKISLPDRNFCCRSIRNSVLRLTDTGPDANLRRPRQKPFPHCRSLRLASPPRRHLSIQRGDDADAVRSRGDVTVTEWW